MLHLKTRRQELSAFCSTCPDPADVTRILAELGFRLTFHMPAKGPAFERIPAQYHYRLDGDGCEVIYLAGKDLPDEGERFPKHQSRFWVYGGADLSVVERVTQTLAARWSFTWQSLPLTTGKRSVS